MSLMDIIFGQRRTEYNGIGYVEKVTNYRCSEGYIDESIMKRCGQYLAFQIDPDGPMVRQESSVTLVGELVYLMEAYEQVNNLNGMVAVAQAIENACKVYCYPGHIAMQFMRTAYFSEDVQRHI